jgi:hypothetical protein
MGARFNGGHLSTLSGGDNASGAEIQKDLQDLRLLQQQEIDLHRTVEEIGMPSRLIESTQTTILRNGFLSLFRKGMLPIDVYRKTSKTRKRS